MTDRALWAAAQEDYTNALAVAIKAWGAAWGEKLTDTAIQAAAATILIHITKLRSESHIRVQVPTGTAAPSSTAQPAVKRGVDSPQAAGAVPTSCPKCGGKVWDNRENKKNPKAPDWKCRDKECKDDKGFTTGGWIDKPKGANSKPVPAGSYDDVPPALQDDSDVLPF